MNERKNKRSVFSCSHGNIFIIKLNKPIISRQQNKGQVLTWTPIVGYKSYLLTTRLHIHLVIEPNRLLCEYLSKYLLIKSRPLNPDFYLSIKRAINEISVLN